MTDNSPRSQPEGSADSRVHYFPERTLQTVWNVMNRSSNIESFTELHRGLVDGRRPRIDDETDIAFGFDTNALYRIGLNGTSGDNAIDYLSQQHNAPVIIPGQTIQEVWNNIVAGLEPQAKKVQKAFEALETDLLAIEQELGTAGDTARVAIDALTDAHADWLDPSSFTIFDRTVEALLKVGSVSYVPRVEFTELARVRNDTKTPPGFRDENNNHGDFFVWADFLYGLAKVSTGGLGASVFVTDERKIDWRRLARPHPLLIAEASAVSGLPFDLWTVADFQRHVNKLVG